jgi:hypothetical protein
MNNRDFPSNPDPLFAATRTSREMSLTFGIETGSRL